MALGCWFAGITERNHGTFGTALDRVLDSVWKLGTFAIWFYA
jgi:hypothetical protein